MVGSHDWYTWDHGFSAYPEAVTAWDTVYSWILGSTLTSPCALDGTSRSVYSCVITRGTTVYEILWDSAQSCSGGTCGTSPYTVPGTYMTYSDVAGDPASNIGSCTGCSTDQVPLGIKPLLLSP